jgi:hypothetical protein
MNPALRPIIAIDRVTGAGLVGVVSDEHSMLDRLL